MRLVDWGPDQFNFVLRTVFLDKFVLVEACVVEIDCYLLRVLVDLSKPLKKLFKDFLDN